MKLVLRDEGLDEQLVIPLQAETADALTVQWGRCTSIASRVEWASRLRNAIEPAVVAALDRDLRAPSRAQVEYAIAIARFFKVSLPAEALLYQGAMGDFLDKYALDYKAKRVKQSMKTDV